MIRQNAFWYHKYHGLKCPICLNRIRPDNKSHQNNYHFTCKHIIHKSCYLQLINSTHLARCPVCRERD